MVTVTRFQWQIACQGFQDGHQFQVKHGTVPLGFSLVVAF